MLTARGFSSHLQWDWLKSEGVWRWRDFASTGSLLIPACRGAFLPVAELPGSLFSISLLERWDADMGLEGFGSATFLFCSFFILKKEKRLALSHNPARGWEITRGSMQRGKKRGKKLIHGQRKPDKMGGRYRRGTSCLTFLIPVLIWYLRFRKVYFTMRQTNKHASVDRPNKSQLWNSISVTAAQIISLTS